MYLHYSQLLSIAPTHLPLFDFAQQSKLRDLQREMSAMRACPPIGRFQASPTTDNVVAHSCAHFVEPE